MEGAMEDIDILASETDADVYVFIDKHEFDIARILEEAVNRPGWVKHAIYNYFLHYIQFIII